VFRVVDRQYQAVLSDRQRGHDFGVSCLASPQDDISSNMLASGDNDGNVSVWNLPNDRLKKEATFYSYGYEKFRSRMVELSNSCGSQDRPL